MASEEHDCALALSQMARALSDDVRWRGI